MKIKIFKIFEKFSTSYWFLPLAMCLLAILFSLFFVWLGDKIPWDVEGRLNWIFYAKNSSGAQNLLSVIVGSMINVAGVVFSITIVALSLASQQFGPRLLRNFLEDRKNQFVLGVFLSTFSIP